LFEPSSGRLLQILLLRKLIADRRQEGSLQKGDSYSIFIEVVSGNPKYPTIGE
jgi:hypothetical protein